MAGRLADPTLVVQLYQQALSDLTHLVAFSLLDKRSFASEIETKQGYLFSAELVSFAIHTRRLIEAMKCKELATCLKIPLLVADRRSEPYVAKPSGRSHNLEPPYRHVNPLY
jgi:hypothetical protein